MATELLLTPLSIANFAEPLSALIEGPPTRHLSNGLTLIFPVCCKAEVISSTPAPRFVASPIILRAERIKRAFTVSGVNVESFESIKAAVPETIAAAILVPDNSIYSSSTIREGNISFNLA